MKHNNRITQITLFECKDRNDRALVVERADQTAYAYFLSELDPNIRAILRPEDDIDTGYSTEGQDAKAVALDWMMRATVDKYMSTWPLKGHKTLGYRFAHDADYGRPLYGVTVVDYLLVGFDPKDI